MPAAFAASHERSRRRHEMPVACSARSDAARCLIVFAAARLPELRRDADPRSAMSASWRRHTDSEERFHRLSPCRHAMSLVALSLETSARAPRAASLPDADGAVASRTFRPRRSPSAAPLPRAAKAAFEYAPATPLPLIPPLPLSHA